MCSSCMEQTREESRSEEAAEKRATDRFLRQYSALHRSDGSNTERTLLGPGDRDIWPRSETDFAAVVKPYVRGQKNDMQDAAAICEAASRPEMRFVPQKTISQQDLQMLHRIRSRLVANRTQVGNRVRGLLAEYGIIVPPHLFHLRKQLVELTAEAHSQLTPFAQELFVTLYDELCALDERIEAMEKRIQQAFQRDEAC